MMAADLYGDVPAVEPRQWRTYVPGLTVVGLGTLAAGFMSDHYGAPLTLMALLLGLALNFLSSDARLEAGLAFASRTLLRWGIVLVGARVTLAQVADMGPQALLCIVVIVALTIGAGLLVARLMGFDTAFGLLAGGAVAICGASAAMALRTTLGERRVSEAQLTLVLIGIAAMSASAQVVYPIIAHLLAMSDLSAGFLMGASIHDVAQSIGAGYSFSEGAGQISAIVKLTRVALLAPVLAIVAFFLTGRSSGAGRMGIPWFVVGFFLLAGVNSVSVLPALVSSVSVKAATALLAAAVTATAIRSPLPQLLETGKTPLVVIGAATVVAFMLSLATALFVIG